MTQPSILVVPPDPLYRKLFSDATDARLRKLGRVAFNPSGNDWSSDDLRQRIDDVEILITSWRTPKLTEAVLDRGRRLKLVAHSAGSVKFMLDERLLQRGIAVSTAGYAMVQPVAEMTLMLCLLMLRPVYKLDAGLRGGQTWAEMKAAGVGEELADQTVGVIGAGQIGRKVIQMLRAWDVKTVVYDPFVTPAQAQQMGVERAESIDALMGQCRIVTLHAPILPDTKHIIAAPQLAQLKDGGILINTARSWLVDESALAAELNRGRLRAAVDVYDQEPLPPESPWRSMPNCLITPHIAASTTQCFHRQGEIAVDEVERFIKGQPLRYGVTPELLATMA